MVEHKNQTPDEQSEALVYALTREATKRVENPEPQTIESIRERACEFVSGLDETDKQKLGERLSAYQATSRKDLAREMRIGKNETAATLRGMRSGVEELLDAVVRPGPGGLIESTRSKLGGLFVTDMMKHAPEQMYESVIGETTPEEVGMIAGKTNAKKWEDLVTPVFKDSQTFIRVLETIGYVPHRLYAQGKKLRELVTFSGLAKLHDDLKSHEMGQKGTSRERALQARAQLLKNLFLRDIAIEKDVRGTVTLDGPGIYVTLGKHVKGKEPVRLAAHLPYAYVTEDLCAALEKKGFMTNDDIREIRLRRAQAEGDVAEENRLELEKLRECARYFGLDENQETEQLRIAVGNEFTQFTFRSTVEKKGPMPHIPQSAISASIDDPDFPQWMRIRHSLETAEIIQQMAGNEISVRHRGYQSHDLGVLAQTTYAKRTQILRDPKNYDAARIVGTVLEHWEKNIPGTLPREFFQNRGKKESLREVNADIQDIVRRGFEHPETKAMEKLSYRLFRGSIRGSQKDKNHSFVEVVTKEGQAQRVLIDPSKQLTERQREIFERLPELNGQEYGVFETVALTYGHYRRLAAYMQMLSGARGMDYSAEALESVIADIVREFNEFMILEAPDDYRQAQEILRTSEHYQRYGILPYQYEDLCAKVVTEFGGKVFASENPKASVAPFLARLKGQTVAFDDNCIKDFRREFKDAPHAWDEKLCEQLASIGQKTIVVHAEDRHRIPYYMESKALEMLQIPRNRPLISLVGGCRQYATGGNEDLSATLCQSLAAAAQALKANVAVPGTQSGIGNAIARVAVAQQLETAELPPAEKAAYFAVSPGGETYYPGNPNCPAKSTYERGTYAMSPVNSILTPTEAGWSLKGEAKRSAPYLTEHIHYAEDVFTRLSAGQPRVTVIGNGGFFTIADTCTALKSKSDIVLVKDTGRFADLAIALEEQRARLTALAGEEWEHVVLELMQTSIPAHSKDALAKEFGTEIPTADEDQKFYREKLKEYFDLSAKQTVKVSTAADLQTCLVGMVQEEWQRLNAKKTRR